MDSGQYSVWYEQAKKSMVVKRITEHYLKNHEVIEDDQSYVHNEERVKNRLIHLLFDVGFDDT